MATSGSIDLTATGQDIIDEAYELVGVIEEGGSPTSNQTASAKRTLNYMMKAWQGEGTNLWAIQKLTLFLEKDKHKYTLSSSGDHVTASFVSTEIATAASSGDTTIEVDSITGISNGDNIGVELDDGTMQWTTVSGSPSGSTITLSASLTDDVNVDAAVYAYTTKANRPMKILTATNTSFDDTDTSDLDIITLDEYAELSVKDTDGYVTSLYYDPQLSAGYLYIWPETDSVRNRLSLWAQRTIEDIDTASTDDVDFPQEWYTALSYNLAAMIAPKYGLTRAEKDELWNVATYFKDLAEGYDRDPYTLMIPDQGDA